MAYRSLQQRHEIIRAIIAESNPAPLSSFNLEEREDVFYRARARKAVDALAFKTGAFKAYYALPVKRPFRNVLLASATMVGAGLAAAAAIYLYAPPDIDKGPLFTGCVAVVVAAVGWAVAGHITHRNTIRQNTNQMILARFTQAPFGEAVHRFHREFGLEEVPPVTPERTAALRMGETEDEWKAATSVGYLLNYFEFVANGVLNGDFDETIVRDNFRGVIKFYHDKCWPVIRHLNQQNPKTYENLIKLRQHYRDP